MSVWRGKNDQWLIPNRVLWAQTAICVAIIIGAPIWQATR